MATLTPILLDAKKEYVHQLGDLLSPYILRTISSLYDHAKHKSKVFRQLLQQVPSWNDQVIKDKASEIERKHSQLQNLITACCVSYTKVLGSIRLNNKQESNIRLSIPDTATFIHGVYVYVAKEFFYEPRLLYADRPTRSSLIRDGVEESVRQNVPIDQLLQAYLTTAVDSRGIDPMAATTGWEPGYHPAPEPEYPQHQPAYVPEPLPEYHPEPSYAPEPMPEPEPHVPEPLPEYHPEPSYAPEPMPEPEPHVPEPLPEYHPEPSYAPEPIPEPTPEPHAPQPPELMPEEGSDSDIKISLSPFTDISGDRDADFR